MELPTIKIKGSKKQAAGSPKREIAYSKLTRSSWRGNRPSTTSIGSQGKRVTRSPLHQAVLDGDAKEIKRILSNSVGDFIDNFDDEGMSPLHQATKNDFDDVVPLLIEQGASVDLLSEEGSGPLHIALR